MIYKQTDKEHYWMFAPGEGSKMGDEFYKEGFMRIDWDELGDLSRYPSKESMKDKMKTITQDNFAGKELKLEQCRKPK